MDRALDAADLAQIDAALTRLRARRRRFHALRTRQAGSRAFVSLHVLVPGAWTVQRGHDVVERVEEDLRARSRTRRSSPTSSRPRTRRSFADTTLDRT